MRPISFWGTDSPLILLSQAEPISDDLPDFPTRSASLTLSNRNYLVHGSLFLVAEYFEKQRWNGEKQPFEEYPPPADENPPKDTLVLCL